MSEPVIALQGLTRRFGSLVAVDGVSFEVTRGSIFGLLGPNGSGKSTIIRMLLGILPPSAGTAQVLGMDVASEAESVKPRVGYMSQQFSLYSDLSVTENLAFYGRIYGLAPNRLRDRQQAVIDRVGISSQMRGQLAGTLSGGWKQRLALACALIHEPDVLFLDEPTAGIDPVARRELWDLLFGLSGQGVTLLVTTHYMDEAERCTDVGYLYLSHLMVVGQPAALKQLPQVTPPGTERYELRVASPTAVLEKVRSLEGVRDATLFGERIHLLAAQGWEGGQIRERLGLSRESFEFQPTQPSLEDVFVTLTAEANRHGPEGMELSPPPTTEQLEESPDDVDQPASTSNPPGTIPVLASPGNGNRRRVPRGLGAILIKEFLHIRRQPTTLFFMFLVPVIQTIIFGYAINTQIENIETVVFDLDGRTEARRLTEELVNTRRFRIVERVFDQGSFDAALRSGRASVGIVIPPRYTERLLMGEQVQLQVLIDGSDSQVATTAQNTAQLLGQHISIELARRKGEALQLAPARDAEGGGTLPIEVRTRLLFNPDLDSAHFFVPGLIGIILQLVTLFLTSFAIVRERELGTLEQLFVTPISRTGLMIGKLIPYALVGLVELLILLATMVYIFGVPIQGNIWLLIGLSFLFIVCSLGLGLLISTIAETQMAAFQMAFLIMLPSILLSGFVFPREEMPLPIYGLSYALPATYFVEILRGIILRQAAFGDLATAVVGLSICCFAALVASVLRFQKKIK